MRPNHDTAAMPAAAPATNALGERTKEVTIAQLVGQVYEAAPATLRCRILEHLMQPLGALSLVAVANGVFAKLWFQSGWHALNVRPDDARVVSARDVVSLVDYVQQASIEAVDSLAQLLTASPMMTCSAAAVLLAAKLAQRAQARNVQRERGVASQPTAPARENTRRRETLHLPRRAVSAAGDAPSP